MTIFAFPPSFHSSGNRLLWSRHWLFRLGRPGVVWLPQAHTPKWRRPWACGGSGCLASCSSLPASTYRIGLTWSQVFSTPGAKSVSPLYMAGLAFTAYGIHWFAMAYRRFIGSSALPDAWMAIAFFFFFRAGRRIVFVACRRHPRPGDCLHWPVPLST